jgi:choline dehydrogenase
VENGRATGVEYVQNGQKKTAHTEREIVLSAGAFASPKILMLSGIGPADHLKAHGIPVSMDLPGVGQNLQDHLQLPVIYTSRQELPPTQTLCGNILFARTREGMEEASPDLQMIFSPTVPAPLASILQIPGPVCIFIPILVRPFSRGEVRLTSSDPEAMPSVNPNYLQCEADLATLTRGVELAQQLAGTRAFAGVNGGALAPDKGTRLSDYARSQCTTIWHPAGTCKMGRDALAVVDPKLCVHGIKGLRVADASVMPTVTAGNTNAPSAMIGHRAATMLLEG